MNTIESGIQGLPIFNIPIDNVSIEIGPIDSSIKFHTYNDPQEID